MDEYPSRLIGSEHIRCIDMYALLEIVLHIRFRMMALCSAPHGRLARSNNDFILLHNSIQQSNVIIVPLAFENRSALDLARPSSVRPKNGVCVLPVHIQPHHFSANWADT